MTLMKLESVSLSSANVTEKMVQKHIADDPSILGLGELELIDKERVQPHAGRLDLLLRETETLKPTTLLSGWPNAPPHLAQSDPSFAKQTPCPFLVGVARLGIGMLRPFDFVGHLLQQPVRHPAVKPQRVDLHRDRLVYLAYRPLRIFPPDASGLPERETDG